MRSRVLTAFNRKPEPSPRSRRGAAPLWIGLSVAAAALAAAGNVVALLDVDRVYGTDYPALTDQAIAQDLTDLLVVAPLLVVAAVLALRGSARATVAWLGALAFTGYNYVIYTLSVHFGPLFLLWVAVLGLAGYALIGGLATLDPQVVGRGLAGTPRRSASAFLIGIAALFAVLWLSDIIAALATGVAPASVTELGVPTNAVHVLDLAVFLPAAVLAGVQLLRRRATGRVLAPVLLAFLTLTGLPILVTPVVTGLRGGVADWAVAAPIGLITVAGAALFCAVTRIPTRP
jgi:hypothetical protein